MANPSSSPASAPASESYLTPTNINVPTPSATFELGGSGDLPSLPGVPSLLGASETGAVKLVGQDSTASKSIEDDEAVLREDTKKEAEALENSAMSSVDPEAGLWVAGLVVTGYAVMGMY